MKQTIFQKSIKMSTKLAFRQLRSNREFAWSMILNMALGLTGFLVVDGFNRSFLSEVSRRTRQMASADITISSKVPLSELQSKLIDGELLKNSPERSRELSFVSMVTSASNTRLVELRFVDSSFPLYPGIELQKLGALRVKGATALKSKSIWIYRELQTQMGLKLGDHLKIGDADFTVDDIVQDDPTSGTGGFSFAPKVFISIQDVESTHLLGQGSRTTYIDRFKLKQSVDIDVLSKLLQRKLNHEGLGADIRVKSHKTVASELSRVQSYLNDYLSLIALVSLFLSAVGTGFLMRAHLQNTIQEFAVLSSLGASRWIGPLVFVIQSILLGLAATILASLISSAAMPVVAAAMKPLTGSIQSIAIPFMSIVKTSAFALLSGILLMIPQLLQLASMSPSFLFQESASESGNMKSSLRWAYLPALILWWLTASYESKSWLTGSVFAGTCMGASVLLALVAVPILKASETIARKIRFHWMISLSIKLLSRNRSATISTFLALSLGTSLINLIPQLKGVVAREIARPDSSIPQLFMFDIQDEQLDSVRGFFASKQAKMGTFHPLVRARLESINGLAMDQRKMEFEGEREQQQRDSMQARTQNLSYRPALSGSESLVSGKFQATPFKGDGLPEISVEEGFAKRVGVKLGDHMSFDVMGVPVEGQVTSLRRVRWTSFEPNFMILLQPGVLDDAPKIWVSSVSGLNTNELDQTQAEFVKLHPNISIVDVKSAVNRLLVFIDQTGVAVGIVAWLALLGGAGVLYAIAYSRSAQRFKSMAILKTLGATSRQGQNSIVLEYTMISTVAVLFGIALGLGISWGVCVYVLRAPWTIGDLSYAAYGFIVVPVCALLSWLATRKAARVSILSLLAAR